MTAPDGKRAHGRHDVSLGPMTFVPELRVGKNDPWAHRKGEPRVFALLWAVYLLTAAVLTVFSVRALGYPRTSQFTFGGLSMLTLAMIGIMLLWPALRLSQQRAALPTWAAIFDLAVVLLPVPAIVWPLSVLTSWSWPITLGLALAITGWGLVAAGVIALAMQTAMGAATGATRMLAMIVLLVLSVGPPAFRVLALDAGRPVTSAVDLASPLSVVWGIGLAPEGRQPVMTGQDWLAGAIPALIGLALLVSSGIIGARGRGAGAPPTDLPGAH